MNEALQNILMATADALYAVIPRARPKIEVLRHCKLVSHRGEHNNHLVYENTLPAFGKAREAGVWGIEFDIRWTADLVPVVIHDADARRVFGADIVIAELDFEALRQRLPMVPSLAEVVAEFGSNTHLMIEIKDDLYPEPQRQRQRTNLQQVLAPLRPQQDYHFLALQPALFEHASFAPAACCLPVAETNVAQLSKLALARGYGGLTGHYLLLSERYRQRHTLAGQRLGTGHIGSRSTLYRELNRGVEWIFSNDAVAMQRLVDSLLQGGVGD